MVRYSIRYSLAVLAGKSSFFGKNLRCGSYPRGSQELIAGIISWELLQPLRNLFRVLDHLPPMWLVPLLTSRSQWAGDLVAETLVVSDAQPVLSSVRTTLVERSEAVQFQFDRSSLQRLASEDFALIERLLERWSDLPPQEQLHLANLCSGRLARKLGRESPPADEQLTFLQDLLTAEFRRRDRGLA